MHFVLNRNKTVASTTGHAIEFIKDKPVYVPPPMHAEVLAMGAEPTEPLPEEEVAAVSNAPTDPVERYEAIRGAIEAVSLRNAREDFGAGGKPHPKVLSDFLGWSVGAKERDQVLAKMANAD